MQHRSKRSLIASTILRGIAAVILLQTLFFKFTGAKESVYIFSTLGLEPWGRWATGFVELVASILLIVPATAVLGALLSTAVISGAIFGHLTKLGVTLPAVNDNGELFALALIVLVCSLGVVWLHRSDLPRLRS